MKKLLIIGGSIALVLLLLMMFQGRDNDVTYTQSVVEEDPIDATLNFYNAWLEAVTSTTTDPYQSDLLLLPVISDSVREKITSLNSAKTENSPDPVLCQVNIPARVGAKILYHLDNESQVIVLARGGEEKAPEQAIVTLNGINGEWQITDISCSTGEQAPVREYAFEKEGYLLKSVPPPLNPDNWHLVFEQDGVMGHTVPLFFDQQTVCQGLDGVETTCDQNQFEDATKVVVKADMSESGAIVKRLEFIPE